MGKKVRMKLPRKLVFRYGELTLVQEYLFQKSLLGRLTIEDEKTYEMIVRELAELRKILLK